MVSLLWCCERKRGITHTKRVSNEKRGPVPAVVVVAGTRAPLQVFEARRNGSRLRPAVRAGEGEPEGNDSSEVVATELRRPFPPKPPLPAPTVREREPGEAQGRSINPPAPSAPPLLAVGGEGGVAAPRARHPRRHRVAYLMHSSFSSLSFSSTTSTLKALPSCLLACLPLFVRSPARPRRRSSFFRFFGFRPGNFAENCFAPKKQ